MYSLSKLREERERGFTILHGVVDWEYGVRCILDHLDAYIFIIVK